MHDVFVPSVRSTGALTINRQVKNCYRYLQHAPSIRCAVLSANSIMPVRLELSTLHTYFQSRCSKIAKTKVCLFDDRLKAAKPI